MSLDKLSIHGFKSIRDLQNFELKNLNVLIGSNGAGKSNFIEIFRMLRAMVEQRFANYILTSGGADDFLFNGPKQTQVIVAHFQFGLNEYTFELAPTADEKFLITSEKQKYDFGNWQIIGSNALESQLPDVKYQARLTAQYGVGYYVYHAVSDWTVYHFHDTSANAPMRRSEIIEDNKRLRVNAANIAPCLLALKESRYYKHYQEIIDAVRLVTPFFDNFILEPVTKGEKKTVKLSWRQKGSDYPMQPYHLSDGTLRFICLAATLSQPNPPSTILIDEPELGLHPYAIEILSELIQAAARQTQVIISTQSPTLVNHFAPEDIIVVNREEGASTFRRLSSNELENWLEDYTLG